MRRVGDSATIRRRNSMRGALSPFSSPPYEHYRHGLDATSGHDVRSVTKSVVGALVGIALGDGAIDSLDATIGELLPEHLPADADPRMAGVTVRQLLSMTAGLPGDDV